MRIRHHLLAFVTTFAVWVAGLRLMGLPLNWVTIFAPWIGVVCTFIFGMMHGFFVGVYQALLTPRGPVHRKGPWG